MDNNYLTGIPQEMENYGLCKTFLVRREIIHIKHILTEIFVRKTININKLLKFIDYDLFKYIEYLTNRIRHIHHFSRSYINNINEIIKKDRDNFFPTIELYNGLNNVIVLDFDGVITKKSFHHLYKLCVERCYTIICTANPTLNDSYFIKNNLPLPNKIYPCKGKKKKIKKLIEIQKKYDYVFYVDNEPEYLEYGWLFGLQTYIYKNNKIKYFTLKTK